MQQPAISYAFVNHITRAPPKLASAASPMRSSLSSVCSPQSALTGTSVITFGSPVSSQAAVAASTRGSTGARLQTLRTTPPHSQQSFAIAGVRTGEEVVVEASERRRPPDTTAAVDENIRRKLLQSKSENRVLHDKLQKRKTEMVRQRALLYLVLEELEARRNADGIFGREREASLMAFVHESLKSVAQASQTAEAALKRQMAELAAQVTSLQALATEKAKEAAMAEGLSFNAERIALQQEIESLKQRLEDQTLRAAHDRQALQKEIMTTQTSLQTMTTDFAKAVQQLAEDAYLVGQCRLFTQQVCQPGFSVVKDASLEPVDRNRPEPTGFVLVPLRVLLHGYSLLPESDRREVIEGYDMKWAALHR